jgi:hypothetical protein
MSTLDTLLGDEQRRLVAEAAEVFGQTQESLMISLAHQKKNTAGLVGASLEKQLAIIASRLTKLEEEVRRWRQESGSTSGGAGQPPANTGTLTGEETQTGDKRMSSRGQGGLMAKLEPILVRLWEVGTAVTQVNKEDLEACKDVRSTPTRVCSDLEAQLKGNAAAEKILDAVWKAQYNELTVDAREAMATVESLISKLEAKQLQERITVLLNTVGRTVDRSIGCVDEVLGLEDARKAVELHAELSARRQELWSAMHELHYVFRQEDEDRMAQADSALRKLNIKKREIMNTDNGGSPFPSAAYQPPPPLLRQNAFQFLSGDGGGSQQSSQSLNDDSVAKLLSVLAIGQSKLATPSWPKFSDSYCSYYVFKGKLKLMCEIMHMGLVTEP